MLISVNFEAFMAYVRYEISSVVQECQIWCKTNIYSDNRGRASLYIVVWSER